MGPNLMHDWIGVLRSPGVLPNHVQIFEQLFPGYESASPYEARMAALQDQLQNAGTHGIQEVRVPIVLTAGWWPESLDHAVTLIFYPEQRLVRLVDPKGYDCYDRVTKGVGITLREICQRVAKGYELLHSDKGCQGIMNRTDCGPWTALCLEKGFSAISDYHEKGKGVADYRQAMADRLKQQYPAVSDLRVRG